MKKKKTGIPLYLCVYLDEVFPCLHKHMYRKHSPYQQRGGKKRSSEEAIPSHSLTTVSNTDLVYMG